MIKQELNRRNFEIVFKEYYISLLNFAKSYINDSDDAKEIVQDVFINLWNRRDTIDPDKSLKSYLFTSVKNRSLNFIRDNKKFRSHFLDIEIADNESFFEHDPEPSVELERRITSAINKLPDRCKQIFIHSRVDGFKYREIADKLDISIKTVEAQMSKALKLLRDDLKAFLIFVLIYLLDIF